MIGFLVDASVAVKWLVDEPLSDRAARLLEDDLPLAAPELIYAEAANALWAIARRGQISVADVRGALDLLADAPITIPSSMKHLMAAAARLAGDLDQLGDIGRARCLGKSPAAAGQGLADPAEEGLVNPAGRIHDQDAPWRPAAILEGMDGAIGNLDESATLDPSGLAVDDELEAALEHVEGLVLTGVAIWWRASTRRHQTLAQAVATGLRMCRQKADYHAEQVVGVGTIRSHRQAPGS